jgi:hypothetical protein
MEKKLPKSLRWFVECLVILVLIVLAVGAAKFFGVPIDKWMPLAH